jgi:hypothetical protein
MKPTVAIFCALALVSCKKAEPPQPSPKEPAGIEAIESPKATATSPPVQTHTYDTGFQLGDAAGEAAAKLQKANHPKAKPILPSEEELDVLALTAAGADPEKNQRWQRGYAAGFRDGFQRIADGKR